MDAGGGSLRQPREPDPRHGALLGLLVDLALVVSGLILARVLGSAGRLQRWVRSGRTNCVPIETAAAQPR